MLLPGALSVVSPVADAVHEPKHATPSVDRAGDGCRNCRYPGVRPQTFRQVDPLEEEQDGQGASARAGADGQNDEVGAQPAEQHFHHGSIP